jgi:hypothetical protein
MKWPFVYIFCLMCVILMSSKSFQAQTLDYLYDPTFVPLNILGGGSSNVYFVLLHDDGRYSVGGSFQFNPPYWISAFTRFLPDGALDPTFPNPFDTPIMALGHFFNEGYLLSVGTANGRYISRNFDGSAVGIDEYWMEYGSPPYTGNGAIPQFAGSHLMPDNKLLLAGKIITDPNDAFNFRQLVRLMPDGSPDTSFTPIKCNAPFDAQFDNIFQYGNGKWMVAGLFEDIEGFETPGIGRLNADFSVDTTFRSPFPTNTGTTRILRSAKETYSGAIDSEGRIYVLHRNIQATADSGYVILKNSRLLPNGDIDESWNLPEMTHRSYLDIPDVPRVGLIYVIAEEPDGSIVAAGRFTKVNGMTRGNIAKFAEDGTLIENVFNRQGADTACWGVGDIDATSIQTLRRLPNGGLLVGGAFSRYDGVEQWGLVRLLPSPVSVESFHKNNSVGIFPNPANVRIRLQLEVSNQKMEYSIFDLSGRLVQTGSIQDNSIPEINIQKLENGSYLLHLQTGSVWYSGKFLVLK